MPLLRSMASYPQGRMMTVKALLARTIETLSLRKGRIRTARTRRPQTSEPATPLIIIN